jgi:DNA-binding IclR family transcriptional regulator
VPEFGSKKQLTKLPLASEKGVPALIRGSRVLDAVVASDQPLTVSDLARRLNLPKSTVHGLCGTLVDLGLLSRRNGNFLIGPHVMRWANAFLAQTDLTAEFAALWDNLAVLSNETITLSVLDGAEVVYIACRNSSSSLGITFRIGMRLPAPFTATGKSILSTMPDAQVRKLLAGHWPKPLTRRSVQNIDALIGELDECRRRGFSIDDGQTREGMYCFGTPVRDSSNQVVAGVAVSLLATRVDEHTTELAAESIQTIAHQLSMRLGADMKKLQA